MARLGAEVNACGGTPTKRASALASASQALSARHDPDNVAAATREREASRRARADAEALAARLVLSEEDLAAADAKAVEWLKDWKKNGKI